MVTKDKSTFSEYISLTYGFGDKTCCLNFIPFHPSEPHFILLMSSVRFVKVRNCDEEAMSNTLTQKPNSNLSRSHQECFYSKKCNLLILILMCVSNMNENHLSGQIAIWVKVSLFSSEIWRLTMLMCVSEWRGGDWLGLTSSYNGYLTLWSFIFYLPCAL